MGEGGPWPSLPPCRNHHTSFHPILMFRLFINVLRPKMMALYFGGVLDAFGYRPSWWPVQVLLLVLQTEGRLSRFICFPRFSGEAEEWVIYTGTTVHLLEPHPPSLQLPLLPRHGSGRRSHQGLLQARVLDSGSQRSLNVHPVGLQLLSSTLGSCFMEGVKRSLQRAVLFRHPPSVWFLQGRLFSPNPRMGKTTKGTLCSPVWEAGCILL